MSRKLFCFSFLMVLILVLTLSTNIIAQDLETITLVLPRSPEVLDDAHMHVADFMGYFAEEGLEIEFEQSYGTTDVRMIGAKQADIAIPSPYVQLLAHENEIPIISIYQMDVRNIFGFQVRPDSGIDSISDLKGKTIALGDAGWEQIANPLLRHAGLDPKEDVVYEPAGEQRAQMVEEGRLDAVLTWEKEYQLFLAQGMNLKWLPGEEVLENCSNSVAVHVDTIESNPEVVEGFVRALAKGTYFTKQNPEAATEIVLERFPAIEVNFNDAVKAIEGLVYITHDENTEKYGYGYHDAEKWEVNVNDLIKEGDLSEEIPLDQIYTNEFVEAANDWDRSEVKEQAESYQLLPKYEDQLEKN